MKYSGKVVVIENGCFKTVSASETSNKVFEECRKNVVKAHRRGKASSCIVRSRQD